MNYYTHNNILSGGGLQEMHYNIVVKSMDFSSKKTYSILEFQSL